MQALIDTVAVYLGAVFVFLSNFTQSLIDLIKDLPAILLEYATQFIVSFLDWVSGYCSYCLGSVDGAGSAVSVFAQAIQSAYNSLSPCVIYALTQSGIVGDLQMLACAMVVWSAFRVAALVRSIV